MNTNVEKISRRRASKQKRNLSFTLAKQFSSRKISRQEVSQEVARLHSLSLFDTRRHEDAIKMLLLIKAVCRRAR